MEKQMTLYDYSKQIIAQEVPMSKEDFHKKICEISEDTDIYECYYLMLLCHERRDYTIFRLYSTSKIKLQNELAETLYNRGDILVMDKQKDGAWEIWIRDTQTKENFAYYLFDYSTGVVEV